MSNKIVTIIICAILALNLTACGYKGGLKSPSQIETANAKKAAADAKKAKKDAEEKDDAQPDAQPATPPEESK